MQGERGAVQGPCWKAPYTDLLRGVVHARVAVRVFVSDFVGDVCAGGAAGRGVEAGFTLLRGRETSRHARVQHLRACSGGGQGGGRVMLDVGVG